MSEKIKFTLDGHTLEYDVSLKKYAEAHKELKDGFLADNGFISTLIALYRQLNADGFYQLCKSLSDVIPGQFAEMFSDLAIQNGIYDISKDNAWDYDPERTCLRPLAEAFCVIIDAYEDIRNAHLAEEQRREIRKESRAKVIGGGFGFSGAIKGMLTAGVINFATGLAHGVYNSIGNFKDTQKMNTELDQLYKNPQTLKLIVDGMEDSFLSMYYIFIDKALGIRFSSDQNMMKRAGALLQNVLENRIPKDKLKDVTIEIIKANPICAEAYKMLFNMYSTNSKALEELNAIWNYFGMNEYNDVQRAKIDLIANSPIDKLQLMLKDKSFIPTEHDEYLLASHILKSSGINVSDAIEHSFYSWIVVKKNKELINDKYLIESCNFTRCCVLYLALKKGDFSYENIKQYITIAFSVLENGFKTGIMTIEEIVFFGMIFTIFDKIRENNDIKLARIIIDMLIKSNLLVYNNSNECRSTLKTKAEKLFKFIIESKNFDIEQSREDDDISVAEIRKETIFNYNKVYPKEVKYIVEYLEPLLVEFPEECSRLIFDIYNSGYKFDEMKELYKKAYTMLPDDLQFEMLVESPYKQDNSFDIDILNELLKRKNIKSANFVIYTLSEKEDGWDNLIKLASSIIPMDDDLKFEIVIEKRYKGHHLYDLDFLKDLLNKKNSRAINFVLNVLSRNDEKWDELYNLASVNISDDEKFQAFILNSYNSDNKFDENLLKDLFAKAYEPAFIFTCENLDQTWKDTALNCLTDLLISSQKENNVEIYNCVLAVVQKVYLFFFWQVRDPKIHSLCQKFWQDASDELKFEAVKYRFEHGRKVNVVELENYLRKSFNQPLIDYVYKHMTKEDTNDYIVLKANARASEEIKEERKQEKIKSLNKIKKSEYGVNLTRLVEKFVDSVNFEARCDAFYRDDMTHNKKVVNAIQSYASLENICSDDVLMVYDESFSGDGSKGFLLTYDKIITSRKESVVLKTYFTLDDSKLYADINDKEDGRICIYNLIRLGSSSKKVFASFLDDLNNLTSAMRSFKKN